MEKLCKVSPVLNLKPPNCRGNGRCVHFRGNLVVSGLKLEQLYRASPSNNKLSSCEFNSEKRYKSESEKLALQNKGPGCACHPSKASGFKTINNPSKAKHSANIKFIVRQRRAECYLTLQCTRRKKMLMDTDTLKITKSLSAVLVCLCLFFLWVFLVRCNVK